VTKARWRALAALPHPKAKDRRRRSSADKMRRIRLIYPILVCLLASCSTPPPVIDERQLTSRVGVARSPVLSRDGTAIAFAAVAHGYSNPQIWAGRADGSAPPRPLTSDASQNYDPEFSPDGRSIYFTSTREPHGLYRVPSSGGTPELAIQNAYGAKISPDGNTILYGNGGKLFRRSLAGGTATPVLPTVDNSYAPLWSPDGTRILVTTSTQEQREPEWWIVQAAGGEPRKASLGADLRLQGFDYIATNAWLAGDWIIFTGRQGETQTLWKVQLGPNGKTAGKAVRATQVAQGDYGASFAAGKLVFSRTRVGMDFWALPLDPTGEHIKAAPEPLTSTPVRKGPQSAAGAKLLYSAENGDRFSLFLKDRGPRSDGNDKNLRDAFFSVLAPDGSRYAYGEGSKEKLNVYMKSLSWWSFWSSTLCENCGMPRQFSPDGKELLLWADSPPIQHIDMLDLATRKVNRIVWATEDLEGPRLSPDGRWISFIAKIGTHQWQAFVAPVSEEKLLGSSDWVPVAPVSDSLFFAFWSAHSDLIYTLSSHARGGNLRFLDAQRLDTKTKHPVGAAMPVYEFDETLVPGMDPVWNTVSVDGSRIILELGGVSTDVWIK
jgi:Tol biopolymer transport system component